VCLAPIIRGKYRSRKNRRTVASHRACRQRESQAHRPETWRARKFLDEHRECLSQHLAHRRYADRRNRAPPRPDTDGGARPTRKAARALSSHGSAHGRYTGPAICTARASAWPRANHLHQVLHVLPETIFVRRSAPQIVCLLPQHFLEPLRDMMRATILVLALAVSAPVPAQTTWTRADLERHADIAAAKRGIPARLVGRGGNL